MRKLSDGTRYALEVPTVDGGPNLLRLLSGEGMNCHWAHAEVRIDSETARWTVRPIFASGTMRYSEVYEWASIAEEHWRFENRCDEPREQLIGDPHGDNQNDE